MATALALRSRVMRKCQARFWSGGGVGDRPADHNLCGLLQIELNARSQLANGSVIS